MAKKILERLGNTKTRTLALLGLLVLVIAVIIIIFASRKPNPLKTEESRSSKIPQITAIPGNVTSEKYQTLQEEDNRRRAEQAKKTGGSAVATIIGSREKDLLSKKESFGIEGEFLKAGECKCPSEIETLDPTKAAKLISEIEANPNNALALMQQNPGLAKALCTQKPDLALKIIENNKEAAKIMLNECPALAKQLAEKNPGLFKQLMLENPDLARKIAQTNPEVLKALMDQDAEFTRQLAKLNPEVVKTLMKNDSNFAQRMANNNPDMVRTLMENDPSFSKALPSIATMLESSKKKSPPSPPPSQRTREVQLNEQQQKQISALITNMEAQSKFAFQAWNDVPAQTFVQGNKEDKEEQQSGSGTGATGNQTGAGTSNDVLMKAGSILFAVLDTSVNSDEPGPIMATITQEGPFKGAKLVGDVQTANQPSGGGNRPEKVILTFSILNMPNLPKTIPVKAVAVDPDTARTALASDVDHHYLLRYGTLFASSFLAGYAKVITSQGTTQTTLQTGSTTTTTPTLSPRQQIFGALGEVGKRFGDATNTYFNTQNTITVNAGTGFGLLILSDVTNPNS